MTEEQKKVLRKIIYAVETGGQIYGRQDYSDFTEAYTNSSNELSITIGAGQWYGPEAKTLLERIYKANPTLWDKLDTANVLNDVKNADWNTYSISESSAKAQCIIKLISTTVGISCQDALLDDQMQVYIKEALDLGVTDQQGQAMCANFRHQGGYGAVTRILTKTSKPYTLDNLYRACQTDVQDTSSNTQVGDYTKRQDFVYNSLKKYFPKGDDNTGATETATSQMEAWAKDSSHGYDQIYRWGEKGDYDCSSAVITAWELAGVPVKSNGASYTGNMYDVFTKLGFKDVTSSIDLSTGSGLQRGDVLLNHVKHTAMYCGDGFEVEASINEKGTATGGTPGDQTGKEFLIRSYRNYPWDCVLRYTKDTSSGGTSSGGATTGTTEVSNNVDTGTIECTIRTLKDTKCYTGAGTSYAQASLFPVLKKYALADLMKGEAKDSAGNIWRLVKVAHPTEGFVYEYIQEGAFRYLK